MMCSIMSPLQRAGGLVRAGDGMGEGGLSLTYGDACCPSPCTSSPLPNTLTPLLFCPLYLLIFCASLISDHNTCHWSSIVSARGTRTAARVSSEVGLQLRSFSHSWPSSLICISHLKLRRQSRPFVLAVLLTVSGEMVQTDWRDKDSMKRVTRLSGSEYRKHRRLLFKATGRFLDRNW
ncbi:uncharacterized [Tachysurus ichikawai]